MRKWTISMNNISCFTWLLKSNLGLLLLLLWLLLSTQTLYVEAGLSGLDRCESVDQIDLTQVDWTVNKNLDTIPSNYFTVNSLQFEVKYIYAPLAQKVFRELTEESVLFQDDILKVIFTPKQDCYVYIFQINSNIVYRLFPHKYIETNNPVKAGKTYYLPGSEVSFDLDSLNGVEKIYFLASPKRNAIFEDIYDSEIVNRTGTNIRKADFIHATFLNIITQQDSHVISFLHKGKTYSDRNYNGQIVEPRLSSIPLSQALYSPNKSVIYSSNAYHRHIVFDNDDFYDCILEGAPRVAAFIQFENDKVAEVSLSHLEEFANAFQSAELKNAVFVIAAYPNPDNTVDIQKNIELSRRRARSVRTILIDEFRIDEHRLHIKGYGESKPIKLNNPEGGDAKNALIEFIRIR